ncbi:MAG: hypothetical protein LBR36_02770 [Bacteroidales bacterium]|jgi:hypothetical protein|nr:hypothetical protein [Bacteroidales bacterium]
MNKHIFVLLALIFTLSGCDRCNRNSSKVVPKVKASKIESIRQREKIDIKILRCEQALAAFDTNNMTAGLQAMQKDYSFFIGDNPQDPNVAEGLKMFLNYPVNQQLLKAVNQQYKDISDWEKQLNNAFSLLKYYFPKAKIPRVYTAISGLDNIPHALYVDSLLIINLDWYLGSNFSLYKKLGAEVPKYISKRFSRQYAIPDAMREISYQYISCKESRSTMLEEMITEGKTLLFMEALLPELPDSVLFPFEQQKIDWATQNEGQIWAYLIEKNLLYSTDKKNIRKFVGDAPFTAAFGKQSPGAIGKWIGWQICRSWLKNNPQKTLSDLAIQLDAQQILTESKYKPKRK